MYISEGPPTEFTILKLTKNELALKLGLGEFLMKKTHKIFKARNFTKLPIVLFGTI